MLNYVSSKTKSIKFFSAEISNLLNELDQLQNTLLIKQSEENEGIIKENSLDNELPDSISDEEAARLKADLKRLNADPEWQVKMVYVTKHSLNVSIRL